MPVLAFQIQADYDKVIRLREEIHKLKEEMKGVDAVNSPHQFNVLNQKCQQCTIELRNITDAAAQAGTKIETGFKKKIFDAQQVVNGFTDEIIKQKNIIADTSDKMKVLTDKYKDLKRNGQNIAANSMLPDINKAKKALDEEKYSLFSLTQERAKAQLSLKKYREEYQLFAKESGASTSILAKMKSEIMGLGTTMLAGFGLKELGAEIIRVRGQFQQADAAIQTLLGSKEKADALLSKVREYAKISPLEFGDITRASQMMLGFNIEAEKVPGFIKAIGDVSMGEAGRFNSLTLAFSQMSATGKLMGQDLLQMINAGFNPLTVMAEKTGKSVAQLKEEMSKGAISAEMVQQAFIDATSAGGKFYNMSQNAAKTINGQLSMMHDALDAAMNEVGTASESIIINSIAGVTKLIENYETVGRVLMGLVSTYGVYRTALALVTFAENGHTLAMTIARAQILLTQKAQALLNATMLTNPYVAAATAIAGLISVLVLYKREASEAEVINNKLSQSFGATQAEITSEQKKIDELFDKLRKAEKGTNEYREVKEAILNQYGSYLEGLSNEIATLRDVEGAYKAVAAAARDAALARGREAAIASANSDYNQKYSEYIGKIYDQLIKKGFNENDTKRMLGWIQGDLKKTGKVAEDTQRALHKYGVEFSWFGELNKAEQGLTYETQKINAMFGEQGKVVDNTSKKVSKLSDDYKAAEKSFRNAKNWLSQIEKNKSDYTTEEYKKALQDYEKKKQAFKDVGGDPDKKKNGGGRTGTKQDIAERVKELNDKQITAQLRAAKDLEFSTREAEIKAMEEGNAKVLAQIKLDRDREYEAIERAYADLKQKRIDEAKQLWEANPANKGKNFFDSDEFKQAASDDRYTDEERANRVAKRKAADAEYLRSIDNVKKEELQAMYDYLKEYGTFQQKKLAIAEDYAKKIQEAENQGNTTKAMRIRAERDKEMGNAKANELARGIDFSQVTLGISQVMDGIVKETFEKIKAYKLTDEYKNSKPESKYAISQLERQLIEKGVGGSVSPFGSWKEINEHVAAFDKAVKKVTSATKMHDLAIEEYKRAQDDLNNAMENGASDFEKNAKRAAVAVAQKMVEGTGKDLQEAQGEQNVTGQDVTNDFLKVDKGLQEFNDMLGQITSGSLSGFANGISNLIAMFTKNDDDNGKGLTGLLGKKVGGIIGAIIAIIDSLGDKPVEFIDNLFEKITKAVENILAHLPEIIGSIFEGIGNLVTGIVSGLGSMFGFNDLFGVSGNSAMVAETTERLTKQNELLSDRIAELTDTIEKTNGTKAIVAYNTIYEAQKELQENNMDILKAQMEEWGKHHSNAYYADDETIRKYYEASRTAIEKGFGKLKDSNGQTVDVKGLNDIYSLSPESLKAIKTYAPILWNYLNTVGEYDKSEYWENVVDQAGRLEELTDQIRENLTQTTQQTIFDEMMDRLVALADGSKDAFDDIGDYWQKTVNRMVLANVLGEDLEKDVKEWYEGLAQVQDNYYGEANDSLNEQLNELKKRLKEAQDANKKIEDKLGSFAVVFGGSEYQSNKTIIESLLKEIEKIEAQLAEGKMSDEEYQKKMEQYGKDLAEIEEKYTDKTKDLLETGILKNVEDGKEDQSTTYSSAEKATYDQFDTFIGIATAQQIAQEQIKDRLDSMTGEGFTLMGMSLEQMVAISTAHRDIADESRDLLARSFLELQEANEHLGKIEKSVDRIEASVSKTEHLINDRL